MKSGTIQEVLSGENPFQLDFKMIGVNGVCSEREYNAFNMHIESKPFTFQEVQFKLVAFISGGIKQFYPNSDYLQKFNVDEAQIDSENKAVVENMFKIDTAHFAFDRDEFKRFLSGTSIQFVCVSNFPPIRNANNFRSNFVPALSAEDLGFAKMKFIEFVQKVNAALDESSMPEMKVFQSKFIESENPKEAI